MERKREDELKRIYEKEIEEGRDHTAIRYMEDHISRETGAVEIGGIDTKGWGKKVLEELKEKGYIVIQPAQLSEEKLSQMSENERFNYERQQERVLVVDGNEDWLTPQLAEEIIEFYYSTLDWDGIDKVGEGALTCIDPRENEKKVNVKLQYDRGILTQAGGAKEGETEKLSAILKEVGFEIVGENTNLSSKGEMTIKTDFPSFAYSMYDEGEAGKPHSKPGPVKGRILNKIGEGSFRKIAVANYVAGKRKGIEVIRQARAEAKEEKETERVE